MSNSRLYAGVATTITTLPTAADFVQNASILSFTSKGKSPFADSFIGASAINAVTLANVKTDNGGVPFGVSTRSLHGFTLRQPKAKVFHWTNKEPVSRLDTLPGDLKVQIV